MENANIRYIPQVTNSRRYLNMVKSSVSCVRVLQKNGVNCNAYCRPTYFALHILELQQKIGRWHLQTHFFLHFLEPSLPQLLILRFKGALDVPADVLLANREALLLPLHLCFLTPDGVRCFVQENFRSHQSVFGMKHVQFINIITNEVSQFLHAMEINVN